MSLFTYTLPHVSSWKQTKRFSFLSVLLFLAFLISQAQDNQLIFHQLQTQNGLSLNSVTCVEIDSMGFVWTGTQDGLNRFDGKQNRIFRNKDGQGLSGDYIHTIRAIGGDLYIGSSKGIVRYNYDYQNFSPLDSFKDHILVDVMEMDNHVILLTSKGIFNLNGSPVSAFQALPKEIRGVRMSFQADEHVYGLVGYTFIWLYNVKSQQLIWKSSAFNHPIVCLEGDSIWVGDYDGRFYAASLNNMHQLQPQHIGFSGSISAMCFTKEGLCLGSNLGLYFKDSRLGLIAHDRRNARGLPSNAINALKSKNELFVVGTNGTGLAYCSAGSQSIQITQANLHFPEGQFDAFTHDFVEDNEGVLWVGSSNGLLSILPNGSMQVFHPKLDPKLFPISSIRALSIDGDELLLGMGGQGLIVCTKNAGVAKFKKQYSRQNTPLLASDYIFSIQQLKNEDHWLATNHGIAIYSSKSHQFVKVPDVLEDALKGATVWRIYEDFNGIIWLSCPGRGLLKYIPNKQQAIWLNDFPETSIYDMLLLKSGHLWAASHNGLYEIDQSGKILRHRSDTSGLPSRVCYGILEDDSANLWISSNAGIFRLDPESGTIDRLGMADGLQDQEYNQEAVYTLKNGNLLFGGVNGFNQIIPSKISFKQKPAEVYISKFKVDGKDTSSSLSSIELTPGQHSLQFSYAQLGFGLHSQGRAYYRIGKSNSNWIAIEPGQVVYLNELPQGNGNILEFELRTLDNKIVSTRSWPIYVARFWYQETGFYLRSLGILIILGIVIIRSRIKSREKALQNKALLAELKMKSLRAQMNPHFLFNAMNSIQHLVLQGNSNEAYHYLSGFSRLLRLILQSSDEPLVELSREIEVVTIYLDLEKLRFDSSLDIDIYIDEQLDTENWQVPTLLIQPYVENAIWHGLLNKTDDRKLQLRFEEENEFLLCVIEDNGIGRKRAQEIKSMRPIRYESKGMRISEERLELLGKNRYNGQVLTIDLEENDVALGTRVEIRIPPDAKQYD